MNLGYVQVSRKGHRTEVSNCNFDCLFVVVVVDIIVVQVLLWKMTIFDPQFSLCFRMSKWSQIFDWRCKDQVYPSSVSVLCGFPFLFYMCVCVIFESRLSPFWRHYHMQVILQLAWYVLACSLQECSCISTVLTLLLSCVKTCIMRFMIIFSVDDHIRREDVPVARE